MKKMNFFETTTPVGAECLYPTEFEAKKFFSQQLLNGKISFGVGYTNRMEKDLLWVLETSDGHLIPLWAFQRETPMKGELTFFHPEYAGNYLHRHQHNYLLCQDSVMGLSIKEISIFSDEMDIKALFHLTNEPFEEISLIKVYTTADRSASLACWMVARPDNTASIHPTFVEDILIHRGLNAQKISWDYLWRGDTFYHFNDKYQVGFDKQTGWYFSKVFYNPYMSIVKKDAI